MFERLPVLGIELILDEGWMGGTIYLRNLVYCLAALPADECPEVRLLSLLDPQHAVVRELRSFPFVDPALAQQEPDKRAIWHPWGERLRRKFARNLFPAQQERGLDAVFPGFGTKIAGAALIRWIPDLQHIRMPENFDQTEIEARQKGLQRWAAEQGILVVSSRSVEQDFTTAFPKMRITPRVWPFLTIMTEHERGGADVHQTYGLPEKYLYLPNQFWRHKNHLTAFRAIAQLKARGRSVVLVCTGLENDRRDPQHMPMLRRFIAESGIEPQVRLLGLVPRKDQIEIFRSATAVVQPSLFEGWSTVVEDARAVGRPLILSDIDVHREQLTGSPDEALGTFFSPLDEVSLADAMERAWMASGPAVPDLAAEARAARLNAERRLAAARAFVSIIWEAKALELRAGTHRVSVETVD